MNAVSIVISVIGSFHSHGTRRVPRDYESIESKGSNEREAELLREVDRLSRTSRSEQWRSTLDRLAVRSPGDFYE